MLSTEINQKLNSFAQAGMRDHFYFTKRQRLKRNRTRVADDQFQTDVVTTQNVSNRQLTLFEKL